MIKFFRKIRHNLIKENRTSKYLLYAIGEIVLVVIGILIALQINNWNEHRKSSTQETLYLKRLLSENKEDINSFNQNITDLNKGVESIKALSAVLNTKTIADSVLVSRANDYFKYGSIYPIFVSSTSTFDDLSSTGNLQILSNTKVRDKLVKHYAKHKQVAERIRIGTDWALPIDSPFTYEHNIMSLEPTSSFLFGEQSFTDLATHLRGAKVAYLNNSAVHYWINIDAIEQYKVLIKDTSAIINLIKQELE